MRFALLFIAAMGVAAFSPAEQAVDRNADPHANCLSRNVALVDDGRMDATLVAHIVARRCKSAYRKALAASVRETWRFGAVGDFATNFDAARIAVRKERRTKAARNSN